MEKKKYCNVKLNSCSVYVALVQHVHLLYFTLSLRGSGEAQHEVNARATQCEVSGEMGGGGGNQQLRLNELYLDSFDICHYQ